MAERLRTIEQSHIHSSTNLMAVLTEMRDELRAELASVSTAVSDLFTRKFNVTVGLEPRGADPILASPIDSPPTQPEYTVPQQEQQEQSSPVQQPSSTVVAEASPPISSPGPAAYEVVFNRELCTATAAYREYVEGLDGKLSLKVMNQRYKAKWRSSNSDRTHWQRRKVLYAIVERLMIAQRTTWQLASRDIDRQKDVHSKSLDWVQKNMETVLGWFGVE